MGHRLVSGQLSRRLVQVDLPAGAHRTADCAGCQAQQQRQQSAPGTVARGLRGPRDIRGLGTGLGLLSLAQGALRGGLHLIQVNC